jgi:hypothetical protein
MRLIFVHLAGLILFCCGCGTSSNPTISAGAKNALNAAQNWATTRGIDPATVEYNVHADGSDWFVLLERQPPTPGAHTLLRIDSEGNIIDVIPGT